MTLTEYAIQTFGDPYKYQKNLKYFYPDRKIFELIPGIRKPHYITRILLHPLLHKPFEKILFDIAMSGYSGEIKTYDGCFFIRDIRGIPGMFSTHSWALAFDFDAETNKLGTSGNMHPEIIRIFEKHGFVWGGNFKRKDPMHFQASIELLKDKL